MDGTDIIIDLDDEEAGQAAASGEAPIDDAAAGEAASGLPGHSRLQPDGSVVLELRYPVTLRLKKGETVREEVIDRLHLKRLNGSDMNAIGAAARADVIEVGIGRSSGIPAVRFAQIFRRMDAMDILAANQVVESFLGIGRPTGR